MTAVRNLLFILCFIPLFADAQMVEIVGGTNINTLYVPHDDINYYHGLEYKNVPGWTAGIKLSGFSSWGNPVVALLVDKYNSHVLYSGFSKTTVGLGFYPVNLRLFKNLSLQAGPELAFLFTAKGERTTYVVRPPSGSGYGTTTIVVAYSDSWNERTQLGASASLCYTFQLKNGLYITPQYKYYNSVLTPDLRDTYFNYFSRRHSFMVSIGKKFTK